MSVYELGAGDTCPACEGPLGKRGILRKRGVELICSKNPTHRFEVALVETTSDSSHIEGDKDSE